MAHSYPSCITVYEFGKCHDSEFQTKMKADHVKYNLDSYEFMGINSYYIF